MSVPLSVTIAGGDAAKLKEKIREEAQKRGMSISEFVVEACVEKLRSQHGEG